MHHSKTRNSQNRKEGRMMKAREEMDVSNLNLDLVIQKNCDHVTKRVLMRMI